MAGLATLDRLRQCLVMLRLSLCGSLQFVMSGGMLCWRLLPSMSPMLGHSPQPLGGLLLKQALDQRLHLAGQVGCRGMNGQADGPGSLLGAGRTVATLTQQGAGSRAAASCARSQACARNIKTIPPPPGPHSQGSLNLAAVISFCSCARPLARKGGMPLSISYSSTPTLHQSTALPWPRPVITSGACGESGQSEGLLQSWSTAACSPLAAAQLATTPLATATHAATLGSQPG